MGDNADYHGSLPLSYPSEIPGMLRANMRSEVDADFTSTGVWDISRGYGLPLVPRSRSSSLPKLSVVFPKQVEVCCT